MVGDSVDKEVEEFVELIGLSLSIPMEELEVHAAPTGMGVYPVSVTGAGSWSSEDLMVTTSKVEVMSASVVGARSRSSEDSMLTMFSCVEISKAARPAVRSSIALSVGLTLGVRTGSWLSNCSTNWL